jgi:GNAT superfamily N-acetyltransferase
MKGLGNGISDLVHLMITGHHHKVWQVVREKLHSDTLSLGLYRDLSVPFDPPSAKIPIEVRPLRPQDDLPFLDIDKDLQPHGGALMRSNLLRLLKAGIPQCYVAFARDGQPCYVQWLFSPANNDRIQDFFGNLFPWLESDEALLEGAYTVEEFRGKGIMACAMAQIAERALDLGARRVITFVGENNTPSLKGCAKAGFTPYLKRYEHWNLFQRHIEFAPLEITDNQGVTGNKIPCTCCHSPTARNTEKS